MRDVILCVLGFLLVAVLMYFGYKAVAVSIGPVRIDLEAPERMAASQELQGDSHSPESDLDEYWRNVSQGRLEIAWEALSPGFRARKHGDRFDDYRAGYEEMQLCEVDASDITLLSFSDDETADVLAHLTYHAGPTCAASEYDFQFRLIRDDDSDRWLIDGLVSR